MLVDKGIQQQQQKPKPRHRRRGRARGRYCGLLTCRWPSPRPTTPTTTPPPRSASPRTWQRTRSRAQGSTRAGCWSSSPASTHGRATSGHPPLHHRRRRQKAPMPGTPLDEGCAGVKDAALPRTPVLPPRWRCGGNRGSRGLPSRLCRDRNEPKRGRGRGRRKRTALSSESRANLGALSRPEAPLAPLASTRESGRRRQRSLCSGSLSRNGPDPGRRKRRRRGAAAARGSRAAPRVLRPEIRPRGSRREVVS